jgi:ATP-dependent DNA helicase RecQ
MVGEWDRRALAGCRSFAREAQRVRWAQYRSVWSYVEGEGCRRRALLEHFGDRAVSAPEVPCCDACVGTTRAWAARAPFLAARSRARGAGRRPDGRPRSGNDGEGLDDAILEVVSSAQPPVGRTRAVEILRGGRSKVIAQYSYHDLPGYGAFAWMRSDDVLARVDGLLASGTLRSTGGRFPKLQAA